MLIRTSADSDVESDGETSHETRVTGILHDREAAKMAIAELKGAGFTDESIFIVSDAKSAQEETLARAISEEQLPSRVKNLIIGKMCYRM